MLNLTAIIEIDQKKFLSTYGHLDVQNGERQICGVTSLLSLHSQGLSSQSKIQTSKM